MRKSVSMVRSISLVFLIVVLFTGCMPSPYYQQAYPIPENAWSSTFAPTFKFDISDTAASYKMYFLIRHTDAYPFSNIWVIVSLKQPGDSNFQKIRMEIPLAEQSGKWLGRGMGEIWEQLMPVNYQMNEGGITGFLKKKGRYEMKMEQNMRLNPLPDVLQAGIRIERSK